MMHSSYKNFAMGLLDKALAKLGLRRLRACSTIPLEGHVYLAVRDARGDIVRNQYLGKNTISSSMRIYVAKLLARKEAQVQAVIPTVSFPNGNDGFDATDSIFPVHLYIGTDNTPATESDTRLGNYITESDTPGADPIRYSVSRIIVQNTLAEYEALAESINVAFEFDIPQGTLRQGADAEADPYTIREFGLSDNSGGDDFPIEGAPAVPGDPQITTASPPTQLARKVTDVPKLGDLSITVRWEIRP